jgi:hypothetical protein
MSKYSNSWSPATAPMREIFAVFGVALVAAVTLVATGVIVEDHIQANQAARFRESSIEDQLNSVFRRVAAVLCKDTATGKDYILPIHDLADYRTALTDNKCRVALTP